MNFFKIIFIITVFIFINPVSAEITVIELHSIVNNENIDEDNENIDEDNENIDEDILFNDENNQDELEDTINENSINISNETVSENQETLILEEDENVSIIQVKDLWGKSNKIDLEFLFNNVNTSNSKVLTSYFIETLTEFSNSPELYSQAEFDNLRIKTLIKMGQREKALKVLNDINTYDFYINYYDYFKLDSYLIINNLSEACNFKNSLQDLANDKKNILLKISIFCSFLKNKNEEAELLNTLLLDSQDNDQIFQKIYYNLKNDIQDSVNITEKSLDNSSIALLSAMLKIGNLPFTEKFLEFDSANLSLPIILSSSTDISLRLKSAHIAYEHGLFNAESLSALYQSVDFSSEELNTSDKLIKKYKHNTELGMALLFQTSRVQLLPITRLESLKNFWDYANNNNLGKLAYDVSRSLIETIEPSNELSDYSLILARAHISNNNFNQAENWLSFSENYISLDNKLKFAELSSIKFLLDLRRAENSDSLLNILENNFINRIDEKEKIVDYSDNIKTIISIVLNKKDLNILTTEDEKKVFDERVMPSRYIIENILKSAKDGKIGELILSTLVSLNDKSWKDVHPEHLKILLNSFKEAGIEKFFKDVIIEIFEESKII